MILVVVSVDITVVLSASFSVVYVIIARCNCLISTADKSSYNYNCVRRVLINYTCCSSAFLQSTVERFRLLMLLYGTICRLMSHLRRRSRSSDSASRHFCFRALSLTLSFNALTRLICLLYLRGTSNNKII